MGGMNNCCSIEDKLGPLLMSMKVLGVYHDVNNSPNSVSPLPPLSAQKFRPWKKIFNCSNYCLFVVLLMWFNFIRYCVGIYPKDSRLIARIINLGWFAQCAVNGTIMYSASRKLSNIPAFFKYWNTLSEDAKGIGGRHFSKNKVIIITAIAWMSSLLNTIGISCLVIGITNDTASFKMVIMKPFPESAASLVVCVVLHMIDAGAWVFPVAFVVTLSYTIKLHFKNFSEAFDKHINESVGGIPAHLKVLRTYHLKLCKAVAILDRVFMYLMCVCFGSNIVLCCFVLYETVNFAMDPLTLTMHIYWLIVGACSTVATALCSSQLNEAAHSSLDSILRIETRGATLEDIGQLNLFLTQLTGAKVGFTVLNMIVITKEVILTIGGVFITYFFLLLQFKIN